MTPQGASLFIPIPLRLAPCPLLMSLQPNPKALQAVRYAHLALGKPYVYGGTSYKTGVDCSGLIYVAYGLGAHVNIPRTSETQWQDTSFRPVAMKDVIPGDLVFGNKGEQIAGLPGHVILAIGGGQAICAQHTGTNVTIMPITDAFSAGAIMGAKRPLPAVGEGAYTGGAVITGGSGSSSGSSSGSGDSSFLGGLVSGFDTLTDPHTWFRVGEVLGGIITLVIGFLILFRKQVATGAQVAGQVAMVAAV